MRSFFGPERVPRPLFRQDNACSYRQHNSGVIYKQERRHEVRPTVCPSMTNLHLVHQKTGSTQNPTHSRLSECGSRQAIKTRPLHPDRVVSPSKGLPSNMQQVALASDRSFCQEVQQEVTSVCVTSSGPPGLGSGRTQPTMGGSGCICLPTSSHLEQSGGEAAGPPLPQNHSDRSRVAQRALVLGSNGHGVPDSPEPA